MKKYEIFFVIEPFYYRLSLQIRWFIAQNAIVATPLVCPKIVNITMELWISMNIKDKVCKIFIRIYFYSFERIFK